MPEEEDKWLKFHEEQCQFKVPFMLSLTVFWSL